MNSTSTKLAVAAASVALGSGVMEAKPAQAATFTGPTTWNLSFFSEGEQVGSGQFSFEREPFEGTFVRAFNYPLLIDPDNPPDPAQIIRGPIEIDASDNFYQLTSFSATIGEVSWDFDDLNRFLFFVPPEGNALPQPPAGLRSVAATFATLGLYRRGFFGGPEGTQLGINNDGSFFQNGAPPSYYEGTWEAVAVPEPSTIAGTLLAGGALGAWTRRKRKAQQERTKEPLA